MLRKRGRVHRHMIVLGSSVGSVSELAQGLWRSDSGRRWMVPLAVFLCVVGAILVLAASVEALAPFIYAIF